MRGDRRHHPLPGQHREDTFVSCPREAAEVSAAARGQRESRIMMANDTPQHAATWLLLPWLANGRLPAHERAGAEQHVAGCAACARELALQRRMCEALAEPDRVTWAPGPSFRKLLDRIDGHADTAQRAPALAARPARVMPRVRHAWRPPGLAWA